MGLRTRLSSLRGSGEKVKREARESASAAFEAIARPERLQGQLDAATRGAQWLAALVLPFIIVVSLAILTAFHEVLAGIFGVSSFGDYEGTAGFLVTALTLGGFVMVAYAWFMFVATGGFGFFTWEDQ